MEAILGFGVAWALADTWSRSQNWTARKQARERYEQRKHVRFSDGVPMDGSKHAFFVDATAQDNYLYSVWLWNQGPMAWREDSELDPLGSSPVFASPPSHVRGLPSRVPTV